MAKYEVVKHVGAIHISNTLSLLERKISNVMLRNAWEHLLDKEVHRISIQDLADAVGFESKNMGFFKEAVKSLVTTTVTWNVVGQDKKNEWGVSAILGSVKIKEGSGVCEYSYPYHLREILRNPNIFSRLNLLIQRQFESKYSIALWEFASGELALSGTAPDGIGTCVTGWVQVDTLRNLLGSTDPAYNETKEFRQKVLKPAIGEVNRVSNLEITNTETQRENRRIKAFRFTIASKGAYQLPLDLKVPVVLSDHKEGVITSGVQEDKTDLIRRLTEAGIDENGARMFVKTYSADRITQNVEWALAQIESGRDIKRPGAFVVAAIRNDYVAPERVKRKKVQQTRMDQKQVERDRRELEALVAKTEGDFWLYRVAKADAVLAGFSDDQRAAFDRLMEERNAFRMARFWDEYRQTGLENRPIRAMFYSFAFLELLQPEDRDIVAYATAQGLADDVVAALRAKA